MGEKTLHKLEIERKKLAVYETTQTQRNLLFLKQCYSSRAPKFLRWLKWKTSKNASSRFVTSLCLKDGMQMTQSTRILSEFKEYYLQLYSSSDPSVASVTSYLKSTNYHIKLSSLHRDFLDAPVTSTEVLATIQNLKSGKTLGRDGLPAEFYKCFSHSLVDPLTDLCNALFTGGQMPSSWADSRIIVIPKKDRDPTKVESFRPISLLNQDAKIFTSIMAKQLIFL